jgi:ribonuclease BN (tRNA processing enzyme)
VSAALSVQEVRPGGEFTVGPFRAQAMQIRHPGTTLAYRLVPVAGGRSMAYVTDNELGAGGSYQTSPGWRGDLVRFLNGVDLLIHDAMYTPAELDSHRGWGHSSYEEAVELAVESGAKRLVLFHHEPEHDDGAMDALLAAARRAVQHGGRQAPLEVVAAQEGMQLSL